VIVTDGRADAFLGHYEKYLGIPSGDRMFDAAGNAALTSLRVFEYEKAFDDSDIYVIATFGFSRAKNLSIPQEVVLVTQGRYPFLVEMLARTMFHFAEHNEILSPGTMRGGFSKFDSDFVAKTGKSGFCFVEQWAFPEDFAVVHVSETVHGQMLQAICVTTTEAMFIRDHGIDEFERIAQVSSSDPLVVERKPVV
jgi:hypothetical protein